MRELIFDVSFIRTDFELWLIPCERRCVSSSFYREIVFAILLVKLSQLVNLAVAICSWMFIFGAFLMAKVPNYNLHRFLGFQVINFGSSDDPLTPPKNILELRKPSWKIVKIVEFGFQHTHPRS